MTVRAVPVVAFALATMGCQVTASLPACDVTNQALADEIVFLDAPSDVTEDDGLAMNAGQAIFHLSCGGGAYCHSTRARGILRASTPRGVDYDLGVPCIGAACTASTTALARFESHHATVVEEAEDFLREVDSGAMPPGAVGREVVRRMGRALRADGTTLPGLESDEGHAIFAAWLACGAPVVEVSLAPDVGLDPGDACAASTRVGSCVVGSGPDVGATLPSPTWDSLYAHLFGPLCGESCHGHGAPHAGEPAMGDVDRAYAAIRFGEDGLVNIVNPDASGLLTMLRTGDAEIKMMPPTLLSGGIPEETLSVVRAWIASGAQR